MNLRDSYFAIPDPAFFIDRFFHPLRHTATVMLNGHPVVVRWTKRAQQQLSLRNTPLIAEMQLYFSCMVKKRVLFHEDTELDTVAVTPHIAILFRPVQSLKCSPEEFAENHPVKQTFTSRGATNMTPKSLLIDVKNEQWWGEYQV